MASNYNRKSGSSGSRRADAADQRRGNASRAGRPSRASAQRPSASVASGAYRAIPGGRAPQPSRVRTSSRPSYAPSGASGAPSRSSGRNAAAGAAPRRSSAAGASSPRLTSVRVGDLDRRERNARMAQKGRGVALRLGIIGALALVLVGGGLALYWSNLFAIETVSVKGVEHLTATEMTELASVPAGTTLLRVDTGAIEDRLLADAWVQDASVNRVFPNTLELAITERVIAAVVEVPTEKAQTTRQWAIASDGMWLMPIPDKNSDAGKSISQKIYEDAEAVLHIVDVPYDTDPQIGAYCTDSNVNNALAIVDGMTTSLSDQVKKVSATDPESTTLTLENGIEIVFGAAEDIRAKERVCLELMEQNEGKIAYINVRVVTNPTWRSL